MTDEIKTKDPTQNVRELVNLEVKRINDLGEIHVRRLDEKIDANDDKYQLQFTSAKESVGIALIAQEKAVQAALEGTKEAIVKADATTDKRFDLLSEKIDGIGETLSKSSGQSVAYVTHTDLTIAIDKLQVSIETTLRPVVAFMNSQTGQEKGISSSWGAVLGIVGLVGGLLGIFFALSK